MGSIPLRTLLLGNSLNNPTYPPSRDLELGRYEVDGDYPVDGAGRLLQCPGDVASGVAGFPPLPQLLLARLRQSWTTQPSQAHTSDPNIIENPRVLHRPGESPSVQGAAEVALRVEIVGRFHGESFCHHPSRQATYMAAASRPYT